MLTNARFSKIRTVTIYVGGDKIPFHVHLDQLCDASTFFLVTFKSGFKETYEETVHLPTDDESTVDLFVEWLYKEQCGFLLPPFDHNGEYSMQSVRLLVFADRYDIPKLRIYILETLLAHIHTNDSYSPSGEVIKYCYRNTVPGSGIRKLLVDWFIWDADPGWYKRNQAWYLSFPSFTMDVLIAYSKMVNPDHDKIDFIGSSPSEYADAVEGDSSDTDSDEDPAKRYSSSSATLA